MFPKIPSHRTAFTLVELLVVMVIAGILSSMVAIALNGAQKEARETRAQAFIDAINLKLLQIYEEETSRQPQLPRNFVNGETRALSLLMWKRDWLRCALPDRVSDLTTAVVAVPYPRRSPLPTAALDSIPSLRRQQIDRYQQRIVRAVGAADWNDATDDDLTNGEWTAQHQSAECLYMILSTRVVNGVPASDMLRARDVGDLDGDGMPEVLDPWGVPVGFIRWPSGFVLTPNWDDPPEDSFTDPSRASWAELSQLKDRLGRDNVDLLMSDPRYLDNQTSGLQHSNVDDPFPLLPMVVSAGSDSEFDMYGLDDDPTYVPATTNSTPRQPHDIGFSISGWPDRYNSGLMVPGFSIPATFVDPYLDDRTIGVKPGARMDINGDETDQSGDNVYPNLYF